MNQENRKIGKGFGKSGFCSCFSTFLICLSLLLGVSHAFGQNVNATIKNPAGKTVSQGDETNGMKVQVAFQAATTVKSAALEASHVLKATPGKLVSLQVYNSKTNAQFILVMDSATVPANGAVVLLCPPIYINPSTYISIPFPVPLSAANGISVTNSSTGSFTKTIGSADCIFTAQVQ